MHPLQSEGNISGRRVPDDDLVVVADGDEDVGSTRVPRNVTNLHVHVFISVCVCVCESVW